MATVTHPEVTILAVNGRAPRIHPTAFIAPGCRIIGDVEIGPEASVWYNCVIRADLNRVVIGARTNIQDGSIVHCDPPHDHGDPDGAPTLIGADVLIGHMALIHGCVIEDRAFVGLGTIVMNKARVCSNAMLAAGAMLTEGKVVPSGKLWAGRPARLMRDLTEAEISQLPNGAGHYVANARDHLAALASLPG
jgi:carbonic anhydrase/acetyltransferase-like protein (isoleucine patch superfamily)